MKSGAGRGCRGGIPLGLSGPCMPQAGEQLAPCRYSSLLDALTSVQALWKLLKGLSFSSRRMGPAARLLSTALQQN